MAYDPEDPRLTTYALGEMPEEERTAFEDSLDDADRAEIGAIRETALLLRRELAAEPAPVLTDSQRLRIHSAAQQPRRRFGWLALAAAACFAVLVGVLTWPALRGRLSVAKQQPETAADKGDGALERPSAIASGALAELEQSMGAADKEDRKALEPRKEVHARSRLHAESQLAPARPAPAPGMGGAMGGMMGGGMGAPADAPVADAFAFAMPAPEAKAAPAATQPAAPAAPAAAAPVDGYYQRLKITTATEGMRVVTITDLSFPAAMVASGDSRHAGATLHDTDADDGLRKNARTKDEGKQDGFAREAYDRIRDNPFQLVRQDPLSTFSIDVDTASYANVRRFLTHSQLPPPDAVRIEELVNYFAYDYEAPKGERPFSVSVDLAQCPWAREHRLARVALKGREPDLANRPPSNLVFLLDVSGSMNQPNKLPLVKTAMKMLVEQLGENDRVAIAVYAGASGLVLPSTSCDRKADVLAALDRLQAGGSTNGGAGIQLAYRTAVENFIKGGTNRVILATDGDFNVGVSDRGQLTRLIEEKAKSGVFLTVLGFGQGNIQDAMLEEISGKGNGTYAYIDSAREARKVMVEQIGGTLLTIAKDVKIQVEFNPGRIAAYRLIGYENRILRHQDFNDDTKDAGEIGAGLTVTAFYELVPRGVKIDIPGVDPLKYQATALADEAVTDEAMTVKLRYKLPDGDTSTLIEEAVKDRPRSIREMSDDYVFATSVAAFGMVLRDSPYKGDASLLLAEELAQTGARRDPQGYRKEFLELVRKARELKK